MGRILTATVKLDSSSVFSRAGFVVTFGVSSRTLEKHSGVPTGVFTCLGVFGVENRLEGLVRTRFLGVYVFSGDIDIIFCNETILSFSLFTEFF